MRVLVCGSRRWKGFSVLDARLKQLPRRTHIVTGGAPGADEMAFHWAWRKKWPRTEIPADWDLGYKGGPIRNREMLDLLDPASADFVIAFHEDWPRAKGTKDCVGEALRRGFRVELINAEGAVEILGRSGSPRP